LNSPDKDAKSTAEIIGVIKDCKYGVINEQPLPFLYLPFAQQYIPGVTRVLFSLIYGLGTIVGEGSKAECHWPGDWIGWGFVASMVS
jgi:hypothetical protein